MNRVLLAAVAIAAASFFSTQGLANANRIERKATFDHGPSSHHGSDRSRGFGARQLSRRERSGDETQAAWSGYDLQSSYDDRDWSADSGNDWWNDRPDRAFPRWVRHNQNCTPDRMWWSGSGWHC